MFVSSDNIKRGRTPPGVRELKRLDNMLKEDDYGRRTPPGVRELKPDPN